METEGTGAGTGTGGATPPNPGGATPPPASGTGATPGTSPTIPPAGATPETASGDWNSLPEWARSAYRTVSGDLDKTRRSLKQIEEKDMTEAQKLQSRVTELEGQLGTATGTIRDFTLSGKFEGEAAKAGAIDPKLLYAVAKGQITTDSAGNPTNMPEVLRTLKASHPTQFRQVRQTPSIDAGAGTGGNATNGAQASGGGSIGVTDWMRSQVRPGGG